MSAILGIDLRGETVCTASVGEQEGRSTILWLAQADVAEKMQFPDKVRLALTIPDDASMVKQYLMPTTAGGDIGQRLQFEMEQSLLDEPALFHYQYTRTGLTDRYLGIITRKKRIEELRAQLGIPDETETIALGRGVALGCGFRNFCKLPGGELGGVLDITPNLVSLCLLYRGEVTALGHLKLAGDSPDDELSLKRIAMEIKTLVAFKLTSLAEMGLTIPLSSLSLAGQVSDKLAEQLERYFPSGLQTAAVNRSLLGPGIDGSVRPELFLPALGMTVI